MRILVSSLLALAFTFGVGVVAAAASSTLEAATVGIEGGRTAKAEPSSEATAAAGSTFGVKPGRWRFCDVGGGAAGDAYVIDVDGSTIRIVPEGSGIDAAMAGTADPATRAWKPRRVLDSAYADGRVLTDGLDVTFAPSGDRFAGRTLLGGREIEAHVEDGRFRCPRR